MPKYKQDAKDFVISVTSSTGQYRATVPKRLMERLAEDGVTEIVGRFSLRENELVLNEEYRVVSVDHLLSKWWDTHIPVSSPDYPEHYDGEDAMREKDMDELLTAIGIEVDWQGRSVHLGDWDDKTYGTDTIWIAFVEE